MVFGNFWLIETAFALRNFITLTTFGSFREGPNQQQKRRQKNVGGLFFAAGLKDEFSLKKERFFSFSVLGAPIGAVRTEKT